MPARRHGDGGERRGARPRRPPDARPRRHDLGRAAPQRPRAGRRNRRAASLLDGLTPPGPRTEYDLDARDGRTLRVAEYGDQDGFPILFSHGTPGAGSTGIPTRRPTPATGSCPTTGRATAARPRGPSATWPRRRRTWPRSPTSSGSTASRSSASPAAGRTRSRSARCSAIASSGSRCAAARRRWTTRSSTRSRGSRRSTSARSTAARESEEAITALLEPFAEGILRDPGAVLDEISAEVPEVDKRHLADPEVRAVTGESFVEAVRQGAARLGRRRPRVRRARGASRSPT